MNNYHKRKPQKKNARDYKENFKNCRQDRIKNPLDKENVKSKVIQTQSIQDLGHYEKTNSKINRKEKEETQG